MVSNVGSCDGLPAKFTVDVNGQIRNTGMLTYTSQPQVRIRANDTSSTAGDAYLFLQEDDQGMGLKYNASDSVAVDNTGTGLQT